MSTYPQDYENVLKYAMTAPRKLVHYTSFRHDNSKPSSMTTDMSGLSDEQIAHHHEKMANKGYLTKELFKDPLHEQINQPINSFNTAPKMPPTSIHYIPLEGGGKHAVTYNYNNHSEKEIRQHQEQMTQPGSGYERSNLVHTTEHTADMSPPAIIRRIRDALIERSPLASAVFGKQQPNWLVE